MHHKAPMPIDWARRRWVLAGIGALGSLPLFLPVNASHQRVPSAARVGPLVPNYRVIESDLATGGAPSEHAAALLRAEGFVAILDLRLEREGTARARAEAEAAGLEYFNIPLGTTVSDSELEQFTRIVDDPAHRPLLVHCAIGDRVGGIWALYRVSRGVALAEAIREGRAIGMHPVREIYVRVRAGVRDTP